MSKIICIGRQFGSGGHEIGKKTAKILGIPFYDSELIDIAVKESGLSKEKLEKADERMANPFLYTAIYSSPTMNLKGLSSNDMLYDLQKNIITEAAKKSPCVIVGRCADDILQKEGIPVISLFIAAEFEDRVKRKIEIEKLSESETVAKIRRADKMRKSYYDYNTGRNWGKPENYDYCINSLRMGIDRVVELLVRECR